MGAVDECAIVYVGDNTDLGGVPVLLVAGQRIQVLATIVFLKRFRTEDQL